jgi:hypothetical protein
MEAREESFRQRVSALDMEVESKTQAAKRVETEAVEQMERMADSLKSLNTAFKALRADSTSVLTSCHCPSHRSSCLQPWPYSAPLYSLAMSLALISTDCCSAALPDPRH